MLTLLVLSLIASIVSTSLQAASQAQQAQAASDSAKADAKLKQAEAEQTARQMRKEHSRQLAIQRVRFGKAGVIAAVGTPLDVLSANAGEFEIEAMAVQRFGKNVLAFGKSAASSFSQQGKLAVAGTTIAGVGKAAAIGVGITGGGSPDTLDATGRQIAAGAGVASATI